MQISKIFFPKNRPYKIFEKYANIEDIFFQKIGHTTFSVIIFAKLNKGKKKKAIY